LGCAASAWGSFDCRSTVWAPVVWRAAILDWLACVPALCGPGIKFNDAVKPIRSAQPKAYSTRFTKTCCVAVFIARKSAPEALLPYPVLRSSSTGAGLRLFLYDWNRVSDRHVKELRHGLLALIFLNRHHAPRSARVDLQHAVMIGGESWAVSNGNEVRASGP
jgi:hypothetical protein